VSDIEKILEEVAEELSDFFTGDRLSRCVEIGEDIGFDKRSNTVWISARVVDDEARNICNNDLRDMYYCDYDDIECRECNEFEKCWDECIDKTRKEIFKRIEKIFKKHGLEPNKWHFGMDFEGGYYYTQIKS
jgi:hypothetical protein